MVDLHDDFDVTLKMLEGNTRKANWKREDVSITFLTNSIDVVNHDENDVSEDGKQKMDKTEVVDKLCTVEQEDDKQEAESGKSWL